MLVLTSLGIAAAPQNEKLCKESLHASMYSSTVQAVEICPSEQ